MKIKLSQEVVEALEVQPGKRFYRVWDTLCPGLGVYCTEDAQKSFFVRYRVLGRERYATLGKTPPLKCGEARKLAAEWLQDARAGIDRLEARHAPARSGNVREHWARYTKFRSEGTDDRKPWAESTAAENLRLFARHVDTAIGALPAGTVTKADIEKILDPCPPGTRNALLRMIRAFFNYLIENEIATSDPTKGQRFKRLKKHERFLEWTEIALLWQAIAAEEALGGKSSGTRAGKAMPGKRGGAGLREVESRGISPHAAALLRLLLLTGGRLREIMLARWEWIDREFRVLRLPNSKTGARGIALNTAAMEEIERLALIRTAGNPFLIEGQVSGRPLTNIQKSWTRVKDRAFAILQKQAIDAAQEPPASNPLAGMRIHDLRHAHGSIGARLGLSISQVAKVLGHARTETSERYVHLHDAVALEASELIGARIAKSVGEGCK